MIFLITICILSFVAMLATFIFAYRGYEDEQSKKYLAKGIPISTWDLFIVTYKDILAVLVDFWHDFLPHVHNLTTYLLTRYIAYRDRTYAKLFGYQAVQQGGAVSFFLKRIVVHKEEFKQKVADKRALHDAPLPKKRDYFGELKGELRDI